MSMPWRDLGGLVLVLLLLSLLTSGHGQLESCATPVPGEPVSLGCPCSLELDQACSVGQVCSQPTNAVATGAANATFLCIPCSFGQYCPAGTQLPPVSSPAFQQAVRALDCPSGSYCPSPAVLRACPQGAFCGSGSVAPTTCALDRLLATSPSMTLPQGPSTVYSSVYVDGTTLGGNYCPVNSTTPKAQCAGGTYCPNPGEALPCPNGYFCKPGSKDPTPCPFLTSCPEGSAKAALSWTGFILLAGILLGLLAAYGLAQALMRAAQRRSVHTQEARDRLWRLLDPLLAPHHRRSKGSFRAFNSIRPRLHVEFRELGLTLHDGRTILAGITGRFEHSKVAAVMGPSGAGKTTFLSVLMGRAARQGTPRGQLRINGRDIGVPDLQSVVGYVPQEDIVHEDLTVRENLVYSARLRLSRSKPRREQLDVVDDVLDLLQLRHVQHQVVGSVERRGISGGQRKRVSIGLELAAKPSILFMDEPTSGLDATAAADILQALKRMAGLGMNVIAVLHQPRYSIFALFDDIMLLGKGGRLVYLGPSWLAMPYFESLDFELPLHENPADFLMDVISGSVPQRGSDAFHPERLVGLWQTYGLGWVRTQVRLAPQDPSCAARPPEQLRIDPEQFALLSEQFDAADTDGDEALRAADLQTLLRALGLEPSALDIQMIMAELAVPRTGLITKAAFLSYVQNGGRPAAEPGAGRVAGAGGRRAVQSIYRVYSIEQYTLSAAIAELSAAALPGSLRPTGTLKELASAVMAGGGTVQADAANGATVVNPEDDDDDRLIASPRFTVIPLPESSAESPTRRAGSGNGLPAPGAPLPAVVEDDAEGDEGRRHDPLVHSRSSTATHDAPVTIRFDPVEEEDGGLDGGRQSGGGSGSDNVFAGGDAATAGNTARGPQPTAVTRPNPLLPHGDSGGAGSESSLPQGRVSLGSSSSVGSRDASPEPPPLRLQWGNVTGPGATGLPPRAPEARTPDLKLTVSEECCHGTHSLSGTTTPETTLSHTPSAAGTELRLGSAGSLPGLDGTGGRHKPGAGRGGGPLASLRRCWAARRRSVLRVTPGLFRQYLFLLVRSGIKLSRAWGTKFLDLLLLVFAGIVTGAMHGTGWTEWDFRGHVALIMLTVGIIAASTALGVFGRDRLVHWRERESGVRVLSYFLANTTTNMVDVLLQPLVFLSVYYSMTIPSISFGKLYVIGVLVVFWCSSLGCLMSIVLGNNGALVASVAVLMVIGGFINGVNPVYRSLSPILKDITVLSYNRWATEAAAVWNFAELPPWQWPLTRSIMFSAGMCGLDSISDPDDDDSDAAIVPEQLASLSLDINVYCGGSANRALIILACEGLLLRFLAYLALALCPRGISFDPVVRWLSRMTARLTRRFRRQPKKSPNQQ